MKIFVPAMVAALVGLAPIAGHASSVGLSMYQPMPLIVHATDQNVGRPIKMARNQIVSRRGNPPARAGQEQCVLKCNPVGVRMYKPTSLTVHTRQQKQRAALIRKINKAYKTHFPPYASHK